MTKLEIIKRKLNELGRDEITHSEVHYLVDNYEKALNLLDELNKKSKECARHGFDFLAHTEQREKMEELLKKRRV